MKRGLVEREDNGSESSDCPKKRVAESQEADQTTFDIHLPWSELWTSLLCPEEQAEQLNASNGASPTGSETLHLDIPFQNNSMITADVGHCIDQWAENRILPITLANNGINPHTGRRHHGNAGDLKNMKCFGMIHASPAQLVGNMQDLNKGLLAMKPEGDTICLRLSFFNKLAFIVGEDGTQFGQLDDNLAESLVQLSVIAPVDFEAFANVKETLRCINRAKRLHDAVIKVDINVYGDPASRDQIGQTLSVRKVYLQHLKHRKNDFEYDNPHMLMFENIALADDAVLVAQDVSHSEVSDTIEEAVIEICRSETRDRGLKGLKHSVGTATILLPHQEQALEFMVQREVGPIPDEFLLWQQADDEGRPGFRHTLTGCWTRTTPSELGGGILADDMGMGKSLSTLSLITRRLSEGLQWSHLGTCETKSAGQRDIRSRATLIVVSSMLIMNGWFKEIKDHLDGTLKVIKYHGKSRPNHIESLTDCDVVLTTYHTLAAERKAKRCSLKPIKWFRVVLDEAHTIRRRATTLFAAVSDLEACHRWCLTGTPIQNTLADLGSLLVFLRLEPFDRASLFRKYIDAPFSYDLEEATKGLKTLLNSICLRRSIQRLQLPPLDEVIHDVNLTAAERLQYDQTLDAMVHAASYGSRERCSDTPFGKFQIQLQLRILCNHGTFQRAFQTDEIDSQSLREDVVTSMGSGGEIKCSCCNQKTLTLRTNCAATQQGRSARHILCDECTVQMRDIQPDAPAGSKSDTFVLTNSERCRSNIQQQPILLGTSLRNFNLSGYSSKMRALMEDVRLELSSTKSIIFSSWTRSLNLVARHLEQDRITYARIDGDTEMNRRQSILDNFATTDDVRVLLMTTGTGAYGLNLAAANRVFILEPQWNPSIENQAVARVQRFLQQQRVKVVRYVVRGTVEEDIRRQQIAKLTRAERGFADVKHDSIG